MNRTLMVLAINVLFGSIISLILSITVINSIELRIASVSFLLVGMVMLPIGLGVESEINRIRQIEAEAFKQNIKRILEEFLIYDKRMYICPSAMCKTTSILLPIGEVNVKYMVPANRFITVYKDKLMIMLETPGQRMLRKLLEEVRETIDLNTLNSLVKDLSTVLLGSTVEISIAKQGNRYSISVNKVDSKVGEFESWIILAGLIGSIVAEALRKPILLDNYVYEHGTLSMELIEI